MAIKKKKKVVVALSGGVDSAVAAALLKQQGHQIVGVFMHFWSHQERNKSNEAPSNACCSAEAERRARMVASKLKIPFYVFHFGRQFKEAVVKYFLAEIKRGRTPNPCVVCNEKIKFGLLLEKALALGFDYLATGHYAQKSETQQRPLKNRQAVLGLAQSKIYKLLASNNKVKDQTYFLWRLNQEQLKHILFPVGGFSDKKQVKKIAQDLGLEVDKAKESQNICFLGDNDIYNFLKIYLKLKAGKVIDDSGEILGQHKGLGLYTIGQRKGLGFSGGPWFVINKDLKNNAIIVSKNEEALLRKELIAAEVNWISGIEPKLPLKVKVKIRYRTKSVAATINERVGGLEYRIVFAKPQRAITPGQSVVFYRGNEILGGGDIQ